MLRQSSAEKERTGCKYEPLDEHRNKRVINTEIEYQLGAKQENLRATIS